MTTTYVSYNQVILDAGLSFAVLQNQSLFLGQFQKIASARWTWFVDNYLTFEARFKIAASGDQKLEGLIEDLSSEVLTTRLGGTNNPFSTDSGFFTYKRLLDFIPLREVNLTVDEVKERNEEIRRIRNLEESDFRNMISFMDNNFGVFTQDIGLGDSDAAVLLGINSTSRKTQRSATVQDIINLSLSDNVRQLVYGLIFNKQIQRQKPPNLIAIANNNLSANSSKAFLDVYQTFTTRPFEISLEHMARKYLGSSDRWFELVTINNLQPPYIDSVGTKHNIIVPPTGGAVVISSDAIGDVAPNVSVNIGSFNSVEEPRIIEKFVENDADTITLFLGGDRDLNKFLPSQKAFVRIFKPSTVRTNSQILIPSPSPTSIGGSKKTPKSDVIRRLNKALIQFGVDMFRDEKTRDFVLDATGNFQLAVGLRAVDQAVKNALRVERGELTYHPDYGLFVDLGSRFFGSNNEAVVFGESIIRSIGTDARFSGVSIAKLQTNKINTSLQVDVSIPGLDSPIPLSFVG